MLFEKDFTEHVPTRFDQKRGGFEPEDRGTEFSLSSLRAMRRPPLLRRVGDEVPGILIGMVGFPVFRLLFLNL